MAKKQKREPGMPGRFFRRFGKVLGTILLVGAISLVIFACIFTAYLRNYLMPQVSFSLDSFRLNQTSVIYYQDKSTGEYQALQNLYGEENRIWASYKDIPTNLVYATVAIEDKRFFQHSGVDWLRSMKASANLFLGGSSTYGASTVTQQLVKNLTNDNEVTVRRKLVEIFRALEMEKQYSKEDIMEWYLNTIYLGEQSYGVRTAAYTYFGKDVSELDLAECASLIAITNNPSIYDPYISEKTKAKNKERQTDILYEMWQQGYITENEYQNAKNEELQFQYADSSSETGDNSDYYSYFVDQVIRDVVNDLANATGYDTEVINRMILGGGYQIYSTIDVDVQNAAEEVYEDLDNIPKTDSTYQQLQSGIVIIDNETGDIAAIVGGVGQKEGSLTLSRATQSLLSPGSTIKPLAVYAPALEMGLITPATVYDDTPFTFGSSPWPKNEDDTYHGLTNILTAMKRSTNTVAVKVLDDVGLDYAYHYAVNDMHLDTLVDEYELNGVNYTDKSYWSLALGGMVRGVTIRDLTAAYASIENKGTYREARTYTKVLDSDGNVVLDNSQSSNENMSEKTAYYLTYMMEETVKDGTGQEAQVPGIDTAGKTGTTSDDKDRWFAGYTSYYTGVVWCGYDQPQEVVLEDDSIENPASVLFNKVMTKVHEGKQNKAFEKPTSVIDVEVCQDSGNLVNDWCTKDIRGDRTVTIQLDGSDVPTSYCSTHVETDICTAGDTLHVANDSCKSRGTVTQYGLLNLSRQFPIAGIVVADQQYCVGTLVKRSGYSEARCDTMDPVNAVCTIHGTQRTTVTTRYDNDDDNTGGTEQDPSESDPVVSMPAVQ
ncbi:MAG: PBP1A family penicillin-binding protein [Oscillospiraceae bacterium]|nr:PBP1A family penicillin-binding protein [Oscillospiraceae bacterium]